MASATITSTRNVTTPAHITPTPKAPRTRKARPAAPTTFRLLLAIGSTAYWVRPITSALHAKAFRLRRADGTGEYFVTTATPAIAEITSGGTRGPGRRASTSGRFARPVCSTSPERRPGTRHGAGSLPAPRIRTPHGSPDMTTQDRISLDTITAKAKLLARLLGAHRSLFDCLPAMAGGYSFIEYSADGMGSSRLAVAVDGATAEVEAILNRLMAEIAAWESAPGDDGPPAVRD
jgi:hypothetical protein